MRYNGRGYTDTLLLTSLVAADGLSGGFIKDSQAGNLPATATNDNASAGNLGEFMSSQVLAGAALALTTDTAKTITSIAPTAGDWDIGALIGFEPNAATVITQIRGAIHTTTDTLPAPAAHGAYVLRSGTLGTGVPQVSPTGEMRASLSGTTTHYLIGRGTFTTNSLAGYGFLWGRRRR